jgi:hypothetical protein
VSRQLGQPANLQVPGGAPARWYNFLQNGSHAALQGGSDVVVDPVPDEQDLLRRLPNPLGGDPEDLGAGLADVELIRVELHGEELQQAQLAQVPLERGAVHKGVRDDAQQEPMRVKVSRV